MWLLHLGIYDCARISKLALLGTESESAHDKPKREQFGQFAMRQLMEYSRVS